jgi:integrase
MKVIYSLKEKEEEPKQQSDTEFTKMIEQVNEYYQTKSRSVNDGGRRRVLSDGTLRTNRAVMASLKKKMGGIEITDAWADMVIKTLKKDGLDAGSINTYSDAITRTFRALGHPIVMPAQDAAHKDHYHYSVTQINRLMDATRSIPHKAVMKFLFYQGPRAGELCDLKMEKLNMDAEEVSIYGQKNHKWRTIPLDPAVIQPLKRWLDMRVEVVGYMLQQGLTVPDTVFLNRHGNPFSISSIEDIVATSADRTGFTGIERDEAHPHTIRHSRAYNLLFDEKWDIASVAYFLGDRVATIEEYYAHTDAEAVRRNMKRMR